MAKFSLDEEDDGERPSSSRSPKRQRTCVSGSGSTQPLQQQQTTFDFDHVLVFQGANDEEVEKDEEKEEEVEEEEEEESEEEEEDHEDDDCDEEEDVPVVEEIEAINQLSEYGSALLRRVSHRLSTIDPNENDTVGPVVFGTSSSGITQVDDTTGSARANGNASGSVNVTDPDLLVFSRRTSGINQDSVGPVRANGDASISVTLTDPDVLDCSICYEILTTPVFQCENGHVACSSCCINLKNKCPFCSWPIGYNRCRALEKVLEAVKISCQNTKYGCKELVRYSEKKVHDRICTYSPCTCPHPGCNRVSSSRNLYQHFSTKHSSGTVRFQYNCTFTITLNADDKFVFLQEQKDNVLFILNNSVELLGNVLAVSCIWHSSFKGFFYDLQAKTGGNSLLLESLTKCTKSLVTDPPSSGFLLVPSNFQDSSRKLTVDLCIWSKDSCPSNFLTSNDVELA